MGGRRRARAGLLAGPSASRGAGLDTPGGALGRALLRRVRSLLEVHGDEARARGAGAYLKSEVPLHGVTVPEVRRLTAEALRGLAFGSAAEFHDAVLTMWREAAFREELFAAITLTGLPSCARFQTLAAMPLYEELVVTGRWWDLVDELAAHRLGPLVATEPAAMGRALRRWSRSDELWKRRAAIIAQVRCGEDTDVRLLFDCIAPSLEGSKVPRPSDEAATLKDRFWLRKAIGWALRELARHRPEVVRRYLTEQGAALAPLSRREAQKGLARPARRSARR